jgi:dTDP-4-amino-4,6-dideoxygalactose transaminase
MQPFYVSRPELPPKERFVRYVEGIFASRVLTNGGRLVRLLEKRLAEYLGVRHVVLTANGTLALQIAYRLLSLKGKVITTPFSYVATTSSLAWEGLQPVFADIDAETLNIDPERIASLVDAETTGIVPVHVFGCPCDVEAIEQLARRHRLRVVYDAAHALLTRLNGSSAVSHGEVSVLSLHSTKLFHSVEGGALILRDDELSRRARRMVSFGLDERGQVAELGINAKMSEIHAAMGLCMLDELPALIERRTRIAHRYSERLAPLESAGLTVLHRPYASFYPVRFREERQLEAVVERLAMEGIHPRRYFHPPLNQLPYVPPGQQCPVAREVARRILCLPLYGDLPDRVLDKVATVIEECVTSHQRLAVPVPEGVKCHIG